MAQHLAKIFGTEEDKVNCPFYLKMGACRHGDRCSRIHNRPILSQTVLLQNMYMPPPQQYDQSGMPIPQDKDELQDHFEEFYEDIFEELINIGGELEQLRVCENLSDHLAGNVYAKFREEEDAERALQKLMGRFYGGRPILAQFCPVTDFKDARCRAFEESECSRGGYCNFMHLMKVSSKLQRRLLKTVSRLQSERDGDDDRDEERSSRRGDGERRRDDRDRDRRRDDREDDRDSRDRRRDDDRGRSRRDDEGRGGRETSEERRAKIEKWNRARTGGGDGGSGGGARETSEERREKIAQWNSARNQAAED
mmetsp:Transcript_69565/g.115582  ORF Transcript_69565/g.115582 Transcript_69565/m.115582 type:complete len:310 (-) Transcript_69565:423-1352(-)|eukprot:CAMPEP_0119315478 /NCGR_PEP_ID=MMETSP1333-20130426/36052_1 /TAXON_ID=418940 /ORGANISM="Scyphosphaera apsteinii, Strain RCC1455" /LENGTH=309 /DNA_ID=CAMNT_0007320853 /DNA_START=109 /DNA_END=1038 /DNA_ORIENTATION=+